MANLLSRLSRPVRRSLGEDGSPRLQIPQLLYPIMKPRPATAVGVVNRFAGDTERRHHFLRRFAVDLGADENLLGLIVNGLVREKFLKNDLVNRFAPVLVFLLGGGGASIGGRGATRPTVRQIPFNVQRPAKVLVPVGHAGRVTLPSPVG